MGTRRPSVPPVTQKNLKARLHSTWERASVRMLKKMRVYRTQTRPNSAVTSAEATVAPTMNSSIEARSRYLTMNATA